MLRLAQFCTSRCHISIQFKECRLMLPTFSRLKDPAELFFGISRIVLEPLFQHVSALLMQWKEGTHGGDNLVGMGVAGRSKNAYATIAAVMNPLAGAGTLVPVIEIDYADAMRKLLQQPHNFAWETCRSTLSTTRRSWRLGNHSLQTILRGGI